MRIETQALPSYGRAHEQTSAIGEDPDEFLRSQEMPVRIHDVTITPQADVLHYVQAAQARNRAILEG